MAGAVLQREERTDIVNNLLKAREGKKTGIGLIDSLLPEGYRTPVSILVLGDPGCGKTIFCHQFIKEALKGGQYCIYIALDDFPDSVRRSIQGLGGEISIYEGMGKFLFIDCYSSLIGLKKEKYCVDSCNLSEISIALSRALTQRDSLGRTILALDSYNTLIQKCGIQTSLEFLRTLITKTRLYESVCLIKMNRKAFHAALLATVQEMVDCVIEMKSEERSNGLSNYLRITKSRWYNQITAWTQYNVLLDRGIIEAKEV